MEIGLSSVLVSFVVLIFLVQQVLSHRLDPRFDLSSKDVKLRCCHNGWNKCCTAYPWEGRDDEEPEGSASGSGSGSGSADLYTEECKKYNTIFYKGYEYGNKCVNSYLLFRDVRRVRNIIALLYKCSVKKDDVFYQALLKVEENMTPAAKRCCDRHVAEEGLYIGVGYSVHKLSEDMKKLEEHFKLHQRIPSKLVACHLYGNTHTIEVKLSEAIHRMGIYIHCGEEAACPLA